MMLKLCSFRLVLQVLQESVQLDNYIPSITSLVFDAGELGAVSASELIEMLGENDGKNLMFDFQLLIRKCFTRINLINEITVLTKIIKMQIKK